MLPRLRHAAVAQVAAALVSVALSGAPRVAGASAPAAAHRCSCRAHAGPHPCECVRCRNAVLAAQASDDALPPCHREAARRALSREGPARPGAAPCVEGTCGSSGESARLPPSLDPFYPPHPRALPMAPRAERLAAAIAAAPVRVGEPDVPPPRPA